MQIFQTKTLGFPKPRHWSNTSGTHGPRRCCSSLTGSIKIQNKDGWPPAEYRAVILNWVQFYSPGNRTIGNIWRHICFSQLGGRVSGCYWHLVEDKDAEKHPRTHRTARHQICSPKCQYY